MPADPAVPIIMVGPGTGIAPFRSFWQERLYHLSCNSGNLEQNGTTDQNKLQNPTANGWTDTAAAFGPMYLFFGCRQSTVDQIYADEAMNAKQRGAIDKYYVALSREPGKPKVCTPTNEVLIALYTRIYIMTTYTFYCILYGDCVHVFRHMCSTTSRIMLTRSSSCWIPLTSMSAVTHRWLAMSSTHFLTFALAMLP